LKGECAKVDANFEFDNFASVISFFIPALSATYILNIMVNNENAKPIETINDEALDAAKEVVGNICGGFSTIINELNSEELGNTQFSLKETTKIKGEDFATKDNLFRFVVEVDEQEIILFALFEESLVPYIGTLMKSEVTQVETPTKEELPAITSNNVKKETKPKETVKKKPKKSSSISLDEELTQEEIKRKKLKKIILIVGIVFIAIILIGIGLYFIGFFESKTYEQTKDKNITKKIDRSITIETKPRKKYINFKMSQINVKRLEQKLSLLTKYEILENDETERLKAKEKLAREKQARLEKFAKQNKEESIFQSASLKDNNQTKSIKYFAQIPTLKIKKFKKFIKASQIISAHLSICKDTNNRTRVFVGPFKDKKTRNKIINILKNKKLKKEIKKLNLTSKEFDTMCNF